jgi:hypothetical protein
VAFLSGVALVFVDFTLPVFLDFVYLELFFYQFFLVLIPILFFFYCSFLPHRKEYFV